MHDSAGLILPAEGLTPLNTGKLISAYYLEIEYLLERIEGASSHYQTLGVERSSTGPEIIVAYQKAVAVLHPSYHKVRAAVPDEMLARVDRAFKKVSQAFSVLTNSGERAAYDNSVNARAYATRPLQVAEPEVSNVLAEPQPAAAEQQQTNLRVEPVEIKVASEMRPVFSKKVAGETPAERRRCERFKLSVPVLVAGYDREVGKWQEITKTTDVSRIGVGIRLRRRVRHGLVVHVTLPLPTKLRSHGFSEAGYNMYAIVRRVEPATDGIRVVGVEFIGSAPPGDYLHKPWVTYRTQKWGGPDRRREPRQERIESVAIEYLDDSMEMIARESAVTEDVSPGGSRVRVKSAPAEFEFVRITCPTRGFISLALVRNQWTGSDGYERLCLQFVERKWLG